MKNSEIDVIVFDDTCSIPLIRRQTLKNDLKTLQKFVGGYIEVVRVKTLSGRSFDLVCNDEGKVMGLPVRAVLVCDGYITDTINGSFFLCDCDNEGDFVSAADIFPSDIVFYQGLPVFTYA